VYTRCNHLLETSKRGILFSCALGMLLALLFYVPTAEVILGAPPTPTPTIAPSSLERADLSLPTLSTSAVLDGARTSPTDAGWPQVGGNARHTGRSPYAVSIGMPQLRWRHTIGHIGSPTTPIIAPDGKVYVAYRSSLSVLVALNPDGSVRWSREGLGSPVLGSDGTVYAPAQDETEVWRAIAALDPGGTERWRYTPEQRTEIGQLTSGPDGTIYATGKMAGFDGAVVLALRPDGSLRWAFQGAGLDYTFQPAAVAPDGSIYIVTRRHVVALTPDGKLKWHFDPHGEMQAWPVVGDDGTIYAVAGCCVSDSGGYFYALNPNGSVRWDFPINRVFGMYAAPALGQDGTIYVAGAGQYQGVSFYALSSDGRLKCPQ